MLQELGGRLQATEGVAGVTPPIPNAAGTVAIMQVFPTTSPQDDATTRLVHRIRDDVVPDAVAGTGVDVQVGGFTAASVDFADFSAQRLPLLIGRPVDGL